MSYQRAKSHVEKSLKQKHTSSGICAPLIVYIVLVTFGLAGTYFSSRGPHATKTQNMLLTLAVNVLIGFIIYELCRRGHKGWAWVLVFLPMILLALFWVIVLAVL